MSLSKAQAILSALVLILVSVLAFTGTVAGEDAIGLYGVILGYVFGVGVGTATKSLTNGNGSKS